MSVLIPTYKRSRYLVRAIESVLAQTYANIEIVVVDDNPAGEEKTKTQQALAPYIQAGKLRCVETTGSTGGGAARNFGLRFLTGEYVAFLDDDDRFLPDKVETQLRFMQEHELEMSYQDVQWYDQNERLVELRKMDRVKEFTREGLLRAHVLTVIAPTSIYMIRRDALMRTEGFGEVDRGQDFILMLRCIEAGLKIGYMPGCHVVQYLHDGERISVGKKLIKAQRELYEVQCSYKSILTRRERRYVDFRFNAVCAFASLRGKKLFLALPFAAKAFFISPIDCAREALRYFGGRRRS